ncbi:glycerophosphodiester phosphodiesterase family protein [Gaoshiqia sp. Z1-71]|uniref:glycerophosphodiester phosphodiesterase family protein n=1 Tax=Gaoshiqia hydrogeniformans TaxID=3290090 RepID=UPI003BF84D09
MQPVKTYLILLLSLLSPALNAQPEFSSHRGSSLEAPENTLAAVRLAWEQGADAVEIDIHLSKDKRLMVIHDDNTRKTSGQNFVVKETDSRILRTLDVGSFKGAGFKGEKIPFLEEIIATVPPGRKLIIELKCGVECLPYLKKVIKKSKKGKQIALISFDFKTITEAKKIFPGNECHWLINGRAGLEAKIQQAANAGLDAVDIKHTDIDKEMVELAHRYRLKVMAWTVDQPADALRLIGLGIDGIESNCVPCLKEKMDGMKN